MARITLRDECVSMKWKTPKTTIYYIYVYLYMCIFIYMRSFTQLCIYFTIFIRIAIYLFTSEVNRASWENSDKLKQKIGEKNMKIEHRPCQMEIEIDSGLEWLRKWKCKDRKKNTNKHTNSHRQTILIVFRWNHT